MAEKECSITINVPVSDLEIIGSHTRYPETSEAHGIRQTNWYYEIEIDEVYYFGKLVDDYDQDAVQERYKELHGL